MSEIAWVLPHPAPLWADGHTARASVAGAVGFRVVERRSELAQEWGAVAFDTWGGSQLADEAYPLVDRGVPIVSIYRALNDPPIRPEPRWALELQPGPYERTRGLVLDPLVTVPTDKEPSIDVLVVVSRAQLEMRWWIAVIDALRAERVQHEVLSDVLVPGHSSNRGRGVDRVCEARVVVGGAGGGLLYEALWAGRPLVARPLTREQEIRLHAARGAGEAVVEVEYAEDVPGAVLRALEIPTLGRRETSGPPTLAAEVARVAR